MPVHQESLCPVCGAALTRGAARGLCPRCLLTRTLALPATGPGGRFAVPPVEEVAARFTDLEVRALLGRGGMGAVYEAWQPALERAVALKLLPPALLGSGDFFDRFQHEARAMAQLDHPNVAQVFETGVTESGEPFIVMELVRGEPLTDFAARRRLDRRARLELFRQVCAGVQHAHLKGVVHRDLKPSNVLVTELDGAAVPKVIDFGLAKPVARSAKTASAQGSGDSVGTPAYMSPEQAAGGEVDTRADIYSLGVLLGELLTGQAPAAARTDRSAAERCSAFCPLGRDLAAIIRRAGAPDPADRYQTVAALWDDLERHRTHQPVAAVAPSAIYRLGKFLRRYRAGVLAGAGALALAAVGAGLVVRESVLTRRAERLAEARLQQGERLIEFLLGDLHTKLHELGRLDVLEDAVVAAEKFHADTSLTQASPASLRNRAHAHLAFGRIRHAQGRAAAAKEHLTGSIRLYRAAIAAEPADLVWQEELSQAWNSLAVVHHVAQDAPAAEAAYREALRVNERMRAAEPANADWADSRASLLHNLAALQDLAGQLEDAERTYREALGLWQGLLGRAPDNPDLLDHLATLHQSLAFVLSKRQGDDAAEAANQEALRLRERLAALDPRNMTRLGALANIQQNLADTHLRHGRFAEAEALLDRYQPIREQLARLDPADAFAQQNLADAHRHRAGLLARRGDDAEAAAQFRSAWEISEKLLAQSVPDPGWRLRWLAGLWDAEQVFARLARRARDEGRPDEAAKLERTLAELRRKQAVEQPVLR